MPDQSRMSDRLIARDRAVGTAECIRETGARRRRAGKPIEARIFAEPGSQGLGMMKGAWCSRRVFRADPWGILLSLNVSKNTRIDHRFREDQFNGPTVRTNP